jgi:hypothetical protein
MERTTRIEMKSGTALCDIYTNQFEMMYRLRKLNGLFNAECLLVGKQNGIEHWRCPYWWFNCRKRKEPVVSEQERT